MKAKYLSGLAILAWMPLFCIFQHPTILAEDFQTVPLRVVSDSDEFLFVDPVSYRQTVQPTAVEQASRNAVRIASPTGRGSFDMGSGVYLGDKYVATVNHVIDSATGPLTVTFLDNRKIRAKTVMRDTTYDMAIVELESEHPSLYGVTIASKNPTVSQRVYSVGFARGFRIFGGSVKSYASPGNAKYSDWYSHTNPANGGDSGGPTFTEAGELIGCLHRSSNKTGSGESAGVTISTCASRFHVFSAVLFPRLSQWRANRFSVPVVPPIREPFDGMNLSQNAPGTYCPPGGNCQPIQQPYQPLPYQPLPYVPPTTTPMPPIAPLPPPMISQCQPIDYDKLAILVAAKLADDPRLRGPQGPTGLAGLNGINGIDGKVTTQHLTAITQSVIETVVRDDRLRGPMGPQGPAGNTGQIAQSEIDALKVSILASITHPDTRVMLVDGSTKKILDDETYKAGEPIVLDFQKIVRKTK